MKDKKILIILITVVVIVISVIIFLITRKPPVKAPVEESVLPEKEEKIPLTKDFFRFSKEQELSKEEKEELGIDPNLEATMKILPAEESGLGAPTPVVTIKNQQQIIDADQDGLSDEEEIKLGTDPAKRDTDGDRIDDRDEIRLKTDPLKSDTDGDGFEDNLELKFGTDPLDPQSRPTH